MTSRRAVRIGLLGMYTSRNVGDTAIVDELMRNLRARIPHAEFVALNREPGDAVATHALPAFPSSGWGPAFLADGEPWRAVAQPWPRWLPVATGTRRIATVLRGLDLLVMSGGGQLEDFCGGSAPQPRVLLQWTALARLLGVPVAFFSVGIDQVLEERSTRRILLAVRLASLRSFRDAGSIDILRSAGLDASCRTDPDPALGLAAPPGAGAPEPGTGAPIIVNPISAKTWTLVREPWFDAYLTILGQACTAWAAAGHQIRFACSDTFMDPPIAERIMAALDPATRAACALAPVTTYADYLRAVAGARFVVGSRLHALILAAVAGTPVIAVSPARKVTRFMTDAGLDAWCIPMPELSLDKLLGLATGLEAAQPAVRAHLASQSRRWRAGLVEAYDALAALVPAARRGAVAVADGG